MTSSPPLTPPTGLPRDGSTEAPLGRRERRKREVRSRIYEAARELFDKQGYESTTVAEIADAADVVPATFFNHFHSKQALLGLMAGEVAGYLEAHTIQLLDGEGSSAERLERFITSASDAIAASRRVARDVMLELMRSDATPDGPHPYLARIHEPFIRLIEAGQKTGELRDDHDAEFLAQMAVGMMNSAITRWLGDPTYPVERGLVESTEFALATLLTPDGDAPGKASLDSPNSPTRGRD